MMVMEMMEMMEFLGVIAVVWKCRLLSIVLLF